LMNLRTSSTMRVKPKMAFVGSPAVVLISSGNAWKARWNNACPSSNTRLGAVVVPCCDASTAASEVCRPESAWLISNSSRRPRPRLAASRGANGLERRDYHFRRAELPFHDGYRQCTIPSRHVADVVACGQKRKGIIQRGLQLASTLD